MQRAMARQAEAERDKRAKVIHAEGEFLAAQQLSEAANIISSAPSALQLRYLQALQDVSANQGSTIVFPLPLDLLGPFLDRAPGAAAVKTARANGATRTPATDDRA